MDGMGEANHVEKKREGMKTYEFADKMPWAWFDQAARAFWQATSFHHLFFRRLRRRLLEDKCEVHVSEKVKECTLGPECIYYV